MTTLRDVGAAAGVSIATVSLVLNGREAGRVKPELSARVREVAEELGYLPNLVARGLRTNRMQTIGMVSDQVAISHQGGGMLKGAQDAAWAAGYTLMIVDTAGNPSADSAALRALLQRNMDGLIFASSFHREISIPVIPDGTPILLLDARPADGSDVDWVIPDEVRGGFDAVRLLTDAGHRRVAFLSIEPQFPGAAGEGRYSGYENALTAAGIEVDPSLVVRLPWPPPPSDVYSAALSLLSRPDRPTAVFCFADHFAVTVYRAATDLGLLVPRDLSVVGFDNNEVLIEYFAPGLTTVALPYLAMGRWATQQILERIGTDGPFETVHHLMPCDVIVRDSIAPPPAG